MLETLKSKLVAHLKDISGDLTIAVASQKEHIAKLEEKLEPYRKKIKAANKLIDVSLASLPIYQKVINDNQQNKLHVIKLLQVLDNQIQKLHDRKTDVTEVYDREAKAIKARDHTIEALHQTVKLRLVSGRKADVALLTSVTNVLRPTGESKTVWNRYYAGKDYGITVPKHVNPKDGSALLVGSWAFDESDGSPFLVDGGPFGFDARLHRSNLVRLRPGHDGKSGAALLFDGMQTYADLGKLHNFGAALGTFTIECWVRTQDTHNALSSIIKVIDDGIGQVVAIEPNRRVGAILNGVYPIGQQGSSELDFESGTTLAYLRDAEGRVLAGHIKFDYFDNKWHHLRWTVSDANDNAMEFFVDGKVQKWVATVEQAPHAFKPLKRNIFLGAGNNRGTAEGYFQGAIDNLRIFSGKSVIEEHCCRTCTNNTKACGDMCIPNAQKCHLSKGCACTAPQPKVTPPPPKPTPKPAPKPAPKPVQPKKKGDSQPGSQMRGETPLNQKSLFPGKHVPKKAK